MVVAAFALRGWRADRTWALLGLGIVLFWIADSYYLVTVANETYAYPSLWDGGWTSCLVLFSAAAWQPGDARRGHRGQRVDALHRLPDRLRQRSAWASSCSPPWAR